MKNKSVIFIGVVWCAILVGVGILIAFCLKKSVDNDNKNTYEKEYDIIKSLSLEMFLDRYFSEIVSGEDIVSSENKNLKMGLVYINVKKDMLIDNQTTCKGIKYNTIVDLYKEIFNQEFIDNDIYGDFGQKVCKSDSNSSCEFGYCGIQGVVITSKMEIKKVENNTIEGQILIVDLNNENTMVPYSNFELTYGDNNGKYYIDNFTITHLDNLKFLEEYVSYLYNQKMSFDLGNREFQFNSENNKENFDLGGLKVNFLKWAVLNTNLFEKVNDISNLDKTIIMNNQEYVLIDQVIDNSKIEHEFYSSFSKDLEYETSKYIHIDMCYIGVYNDDKEYYNIYQSNAACEGGYTDRFRLINVEWVNDKVYLYEREGLDGPIYKYTLKLEDISYKYISREEYTPMENFDISNAF